MLEYVRGCVEDRGPDWVVLDLHGLGLRVQVPVGTAGALPPPGSEAKLWTYLYVREDTRAIYGFGSPEERALFVQLLGVSGVGPRVALATLSALRVDQLAAAIESGDEATLARIPGVGKRTASRLVLELKGKLRAPDGAVPLGAGQDVALEALLALGYTRAEAAAMLASVPPGEGRTDEDLISLALQARGRGMGR